MSNLREFAKNIFASLKSHSLKHGITGSCFVLLFAICHLTANAQPAADTSVKLKDALQIAGQQYPLLKARQYEINAAERNVDVTKYSKLPTIDASYQAGFGTANNLTGIFYPSGILPMTGPPSVVNQYSPAAGTASSLLLNWQAISFGERNAAINVSTAEVNSQRSFYQWSLLQHEVNVIDTYLDLVLTYELVNIQAANIERAATNLKQSRVLVTSGIKPGVDSALFLSELSKATTQWLNAKKQQDLLRIKLGQLMAIDALPVPADSNLLHYLPVFEVTTDSSFSNNPQLQYAQRQVELDKSKELLLKKSYLPKLNVWGTGFARGSGFQADGSIKTWDGFALSRFNYGAGLQLTFPIMKYGEIKRAIARQDFLLKASNEKAEESKFVLSAQQKIANATYSSSITIATETKQQLKAGEYAFNAMQTRYNTGLANFSDLVQAQYSLLQAALENRKAYWEVWKSVLLEAAVKGDVNILINAIR